MPAAESTRIVARIFVIISACVLRTFYGLDFDQKLAKE